MLIWLKVPENCVSVLYTRHIKEPDCLFEVKARQMPDMPVLKIFSLFLGLSLRMTLWSYHAVSAQVENKVL